MLIHALIYIFVYITYAHIFICGLVYRDVAVEFERAFFIDTF